MAALALSPAQRRGADTAMLDPQPLVQVDQVGGFLGHDRGPALRSRAGQLCDIGQRDVPAGRDCLDVGG